MIHRFKKSNSKLPASEVKKSKLVNYVSRKIKGITLVELMIVISLIAILAAISIPIYSDYKTRARIGGEITKIGSVKAQINEIISLGDFSEGDQIRNIYIYYASKCWCCY